MNTNAIIEAAHANDTLAVALGKPSGALRITYYAILVVLLSAIAWAYCSVVDVSVHAVGAVRPAEGVQTVQSATTAYLASVRVAENQWVNTGDTLAVLDAEALRQKERFAREKYDRLCREITDVQNVQALNSEARFTFPLYAAELHVRLQERNVMLQELKTLESKLKRQEDLFAKKFASAEEYEQAKFLCEQKTLALKQWHENQMRSASERIQQIELQRVELHGELKALAIENDKSVLRAPVTGFVAALNFKTSNVLVKSGEPFCTISPNGQHVAEFYIAPRDVGFVREGLRVNYQMEAFSFQEWGMIQGTVAHVAKDVTVNEKATQFKVTGTFEGLQLHSARLGKSASIKSGMSYRANIVVAQKRLITMLWDKTVDFFAL